MGKSINLGKLFGIQFRLHFTWFIIFIIVTVTLVAPNYSDWTYWITGIITSLLFFASVIAHELAHSLVGRANGVPINNITLFIFGGIAQISREAKEAGIEFKMAIAGPLCSLVIGGIFGLIFWVVESHVPEPVDTMILWLAVMNSALAVFNLVPGFPLDGGRILRSVMWRITGNYKRSTRIAARIGQAIGIIFIIGGIIIFIINPFDMTWFDGIWFSLIGWFLLAVATVSYRQVPEQEQHTLNSVNNMVSTVSDDNLQDDSAETNS